MISDQKNSGLPTGVPWENSSIPAKYGITGLGPSFITIENFSHIQTILIDLLEFHLTDVQGNFHLFEVGNGGNGASIIVEHTENAKKAIEGFGTVHHLALRVVDQEALRFWIKKIEQTNIPSSGFIDRFYFASEYFRVAPGVLFELATDGPGFFQDETYETAGEKLTLPPVLEKKRAQIEGYIRPLDTSDANKKRKE